MTKKLSQIGEGRIVSAVENLGVISFECIWQWQPIEDAPEDTRVLVVCDEGVCTACNDSGVWFSDPPVNYNDEGLFLLYVTHWMPLPEASKE